VYSFEIAMIARIFAVVNYFLTKITGLNLSQIIA